MSKDFQAGQLRIVLVGTQHPGNIGASARAMKTMGLRRLVLVAPDYFPHHEADAMAAGANDVLVESQRVDTLAEAVADCSLVLGCTARTRRIALDEITPRAAAARIVDGTAAGMQIALVFGRERTGLTNEELQLCHTAVHIPADVTYTSLNLAAAVQVLAYEWRMATLQREVVPSIKQIGFLKNGGEGPSAESISREPLAMHAELEGFFTQLADTLDAIDFHKGRAPHSALRKLRRIYLRTGLSQKEVRLLRGILADTQRIASIAEAPSKALRPED